MKKEKINFIYNLIYQIFVLIMPLVTAPYVSRIFGPNGIGTYSYYFSIATYFTYVEMLGINNYGVRSIAKCLNQKDRTVVFLEIYTVQFSLSIIVLLVYFLYALLFVKTQSTVALCMIPYVVSGGLDINWFFWGTEQFKLTTIRNCIIKTLTIIAVFILIKQESDLLLYCIILSSSYFLSQIILWRFVVKQIPFSCFRLNFQEYFKHLKSLLILFIPVLAVTIYRFMDKIMLGSILGMDYVGIYESAEKIVGVPSVVITALGTTMLPRMTNILSQKDDRSFQKTFEVCFILALIFSIAIVFGLLSVSDIFIPFYFGESFIDSSTVLKILGFALLFSSWASVVRTQYLIPKEKDNIYITSVIIGAFSNVILNMFLIPSYDAKGAAIATVIAEASVAIYQIIKLSDEINCFKYLLRGLCYLPIGMTMFFSITWLNTKLVPKPLLVLLLDVLFGAIIYVSLCIFLFFIQKKITLLRSTKYHL